MSRKEARFTKTVWNFSEKPHEKTDKNRQFLSGVGLLVLFHKWSQILMIFTIFLYTSLANTEIANFMASAIKTHLEFEMCHWFVVKVGKHSSNSEKSSLFLLSNWISKLAGLKKKWISSHWFELNKAFNSILIKMLSKLAEVIKSDRNENDCDTITHQNAHTMSALCRKIHWIGQDHIWIVSMSRFHQLYHCHTFR